MNSYHGTDSATANTISNGGVNVTIGGGELGRGFYTGEHLHEAKAWAFHRYGEKKNNVVKFEVDDASIEQLRFHVFSKYPPAEPGALVREPLEAANQGC